MSTRKSCSWTCCWSHHFAPVVCQDYSAIPSDIGPHATPPKDPGSISHPTSLDVHDAISKLFLFLFMHLRGATATVIVSARQTCNFRSSQSYVVNVLIYRDIRFRGAPTKGTEDRSLRGKPRNMASWRTREWLRAHVLGPRTLRRCRCVDHTSETTISVSNGLNHTSSQRCPTCRELSSTTQLACEQR